jgi:hypothetical protein
MDAGYAKAILSKLGSTGTPPEFGIETFSVGLDHYLKVLESEYLQGVLKYNLSSFKLVVGNYGGGKTHFLYSVRNLAFANNYVVAYATLSPTECPFDRLELVYRQIVSNLMPPMNEENLAKPWEKGIEPLLRHWYHKIRGQGSGVGGQGSPETGSSKSEILNPKPDLEFRASSFGFPPGSGDGAQGVSNLRDYVSSLKGTESSSFLNAVKAAFNALVAEDEDAFASVVQWLKGEEIGQDIRAYYRISERVDKTTAFRMLRSLIQWIHSVGYSGLILLFDEAERGMSISSTRDRRRALDNLRQLVDECGNSRLPGAMFFYAVPDENLLLDGTGGVYEALKQRLRSAFAEMNPVGVKIDLEKLDLEPMEFLRALGLKLLNLFESAYVTELPRNEAQKALDLLGSLALSAFAYDVSYRRLFVVGAIEAFHKLRANPTAGFTAKDAEGILRVTSRRLGDEEKKEVEAEEF